MYLDTCVCHNRAIRAHSSGERGLGIGLSTRPNEDLGLERLDDVAIAA